MTIKHHPDDATLMSYAAGSLPEALAAVVATHVAMCPCCAREVNSLEVLGTSLMEDLAPVEMLGRSPPVSLRSLQHRARPPAATLCEVPKPLAAHIGPKYDDIRWRWLAPGVWHHPLPLKKRSCGDLRLVKVAPGKAIPEHGHDGTELTLTLRGAYRDETGEFGVGDLSELDHSVEHQPISDPEAGCICLLAAEGKARFKSLLARLVQPLTRI